jgi:hypothetical protein
MFFFFRFFEVGICSKDPKVDLTFINVNMPFTKHHLIIECWSNVDHEH